MRLYIVRDKFCGDKLSWLSSMLIYHLNDYVRVKHSPCNSIREISVSRKFVELFLVHFISLNMARVNTVTLTTAHVLKSFDNLISIKHVRYELFQNYSNMYSNVLNSLQSLYYKHNS